MRVLVLGSGAKDHAITWLFSQSRLISGLFVAKGNIGTDAIATNLVDVDPSSPEQVYKACQEYKINFVFVGTEAPLFTGVIDFLKEKGIRTFGAPKNALHLEGDRQFAKNFTSRHNIPTPGYKLFEDEESLSAYLLRHEGQRFVLKKNALAPSRIMVNSSDHNILIDFARDILTQDSIILEESISGLPITITVFTDNNGYLMLPISSDYTRSEEGDIGAATGGMGSICPVPISSIEKNQIIESIIEPTLYGMRVEQFAYKGVLTFSVILTQTGPVLVDYHVRFNDPATQAIVPLITSDIIEILEAMEMNQLSSFKLQVTHQSTVAVVVASKGYPSQPEINKEVAPIPLSIRNNLIIAQPFVFYGAVSKKGDKALTNGGRNVTIVGTGKNIIEANKQAYAYIDSVQFEGAWHRRDIGNRFFEN
ncbi:MAG: phosphoribosylamine--glycine ligase [Spirochaetia bacterium]|nr:phosphoribosylamine--glycine ligase [Spirochaetia bacterium]